MEDFLPAQRLKAFQSDLSRFKRYGSTRKSVPFTDDLQTLKRLFEDFQALSEDRANVSEHFRKFPKISEDNQRLPETSKEDPKMIFQSYTNSFLSISSQ